MSIILYPSGVTENYTASGLVFTDDEILHIFDDFDSMRSARMTEVPNTWCVWGENKDNDETNYNRLASDIFKEDIFSHVMFIHDTEIDPSWMLTDDIILKGYDEFRDSLLGFMDKMAEAVLKEQKTSDSMLFLTTIGPTEDKRVLFEFDPHKQPTDFYNDSNFGNFAVKMKEYFNTYKSTKMFFIYHDKKSVVYCADANVEFLVQKLIEYFTRHEDYEYCTVLRDRFNKWQLSISKPKKKRQPKNGTNN